MSVASLQAFIAALSASASPPAPVNDPVVLTSVLTADLAGKASNSDLLGLAQDTLTAISDLKPDDIGAVAKVPTVAALANLPPAAGAVSALTAGGREGLFGWFSGDYSLGVSSDPLRGLYISANGVAPALGAWVRLGSWATDGVAVSWFGLTFVDDTAAIQAALNFASNLATKLVRQGSQQLTFSSTITVPDGVRVVGNKIGAWKQAAGTNLADLVTLGNGAAWIEAGLDGNWPANPTVSPARVGIRIGASNDVTVRGSRLTNFAGYGVVVNGGKRIKVVDNRISNYYANGIQIYGADGYDENLIDNNTIDGIGWGGINVANSSGNVVSRNRVTGYLIGAPGNRLTVNTSGNTVTWVSGPKFTGLRAGNWVVLNGGAEFRITQVVSDTVLTVGTTLPSLSNAKASAGSGDLTGIVQGSYNKVYGNVIRDTTTFGFGYSLGTTNFDCSFNEFYSNTLINIGKNAVNASGALAGGGGTLSGNVIADNKLVNVGVGGGIGASDQIAIFLSGTRSGGIVNSYIRGNSVASFYGDGQTTYWLGTDGLLDAGSVIVQENQAYAVANDGIYKGIKSITLSAAWGSTAAVSNIMFDGRSVQFNITANGSGLATGGNITISKIVETSTSQPHPTAKVVTGTGYIPQMWGEQLSTLGTWVVYQLDNLTPSAGQVFTVLMKD